MLVFESMQMYVQTSYAVESFLLFFVIVLQKKTQTMCFSETVRAWNEIKTLNAMAVKV